jgi:L-fuculose-phosphate aldolase
METYAGGKEAVFKWSRWLSEHGYFGSRLGSGGNVSMLDRRAQRLFVTPSGRPYRQMRAVDICVLDIDQNLIEGELAPSMETGMHLAVYRRRPDVNAVVHTHQMYASALSLIGKPIPALFDEVVYEIGPTVDVIPYAVSGSRQLAEQAAGLSANGCFCYLIQNHGALSLGTDLPQAVKRAEILEKTAHAYYLALTTGEPISTLPEDAVQHMLTLQAQKAQKAQKGDAL